MTKHYSRYFTAAADRRDLDPVDDVDDATGLTFTCAAPLGPVGLALMDRAEPFGQ